MSNTHKYLLYFISIELLVVIVLMLYPPINWEFLIKNPNSNLGSVADYITIVLGIIGAVFVKRAYDAQRESNQQQIKSNNFNTFLILLNNIKDTVNNVILIRTESKDIKNEKGEVIAKDINRTELRGKYALAIIAEALQENPNHFNKFPEREKQIDNILFSLNILMKKVNRDNLSELDYSTMCIQIRELYSYQLHPEIQNIIIHAKKSNDVTRKALATRLDNIHKSIQDKYHVWVKESKEASNEEKIKP